MNLRTFIAATAIASAAALPTRAEDANPRVPIAMFLVYLTNCGGHAPAVTEAQRETVRTFALISGIDLNDAGERMKLANAASVLLAQAKRGKGGLATFCKAASEGLGN